MREMFKHTAGRVFLSVLFLSLLALLGAVAAGVMEVPKGETPILWFGWITQPLALGIGFVLIWLVAYLVYFSFFWPYR